MFHISRFFSKSLEIRNCKWTRLRTNPSPLVADISKCWPFCTITLGIKAFKLAVQRKLKGCPSWQRVTQCRIFGGGGKNQQSFALCPISVSLHLAIYILQNLISEANTLGFLLQKKQYSTQILRLRKRVWFIPPLHVCLSGGSQQECPQGHSN